MNRVLVFVLALLALSCVVVESKKYTVNFRGMLSDFCTNDTDIEGCDDDTGALDCNGEDPICPGDCEETACPTQAPCPLECPTPEPMECPTPEPMECPTAAPCPLECPTPEPQGTPEPMECPTAAPCPLECPTAAPCPLECPTPEPQGTPEPMECPTAAPCPLECPTPEPQGTPEPMECPTPEPMECPTAAPCPLECPTPEPMECPTPEPQGTPEPMECPTPAPCPLECPTPAPPCLSCPIGEDLICSSQCGTGPGKICNGGAAAICPEDCLDDCGPPEEVECGDPDAEDTVQIGIAFAITGYASEDRGLFYGTLLAISEINSAGGLNVGGESKDVTFTVVDTGSDPEVAKVAVDSLVSTSCVPVVVGLQTSAERKESIPVINDANALLLQPVRWEGAEFDSQIFHTGGDIAQTVVGAIDFAFDDLNRDSFILVGSDDVDSRLINTFASEYIRSRGGSVSLEGYIPLGMTEVEDELVFNINGLGNQLRDVNDCDPEELCHVVLSSVYGMTANRIFFNAMSARRISKVEKPVISLRMTEYDVRNATQSRLHYIARNYLQTVDAEFGPNGDFQTRMEQFIRLSGLGEEYPDITDDTMVNAYNAVRLWAAAVNARGTTDPAVIRQELVGSTFHSEPSGAVMFSDQHTVQTKNLYIAQIQKDVDDEFHRPVLVKTYENIDSDLYPDTLGTEATYDAILNAIFALYGNNWQGPSF